MASRRTLRADGRALSIVGVTSDGTPDMAIRASLKECQSGVTEYCYVTSRGFFESLIMIDKCTTSEGLMVWYTVQAFFSRFFSRQYAGQVNFNPLLVIMYRFAFPFALMLSTLRLSPNQITTLSLLSAAISVAALTLGMNGVFCAFWGVAVLLDFCDGTVARMTGQVRTTAFRYDHSSDLIKIFLVILGAGYRYGEPLVWGLCFATSFAFMFYMVLNHDLGSTRQRLGDTADGRVSSRAAASHGESVSILQVFKSVLLTINGHTLLVFFLLPLGETEAILALGYFLMLSVLRAARCIHIMLSLPK